MPDLLVSVAEGIPLGEALRFPQLERLGGDALLFVMTMRDGRAVVTAVIQNARYGVRGLEGGFTRALAHDITSLLPLLGCPEGEAATWAATPRILTRADVMRLRDALGVHDAAVPPPPEAIVEDATLEALRAAVWAEPADDHLRSVYADALIERGDPRGTLVALQLARAKTGAAPRPRERDLVAAHLDACLGPLAPYVSEPVLRRGFLAEATLRTPVTLPAAMLTHPAWSTVEALTSSHVPLLTSPALRSLKRVAIDGVAVMDLANAKHSLTIETLVGPPLPPLAPGGLRPNSPLPCEQLFTPLGIVEVGALANLRAVSVNDFDRQETLRLLRSRFAQRLRHVDLVSRADAPRLGSFVEEAAVSPWERLTLRFWHPLPGREVTIGDLAIGLADWHIIVEVASPKRGADATAIAALVQPFIRPTTRGIELRDLSHPHDVAFVQRDLIRALTQLGRPFTVRPAPTRPLAP